MSNGLPPSTKQLVVEGSIALIALAVGLIIAWSLGVFRKRSVAGDARARFDVDLAPALWGIALVGFGAWQFVPSLYVVMKQPTQQMAPATAPATSATAPSTRPSIQFSTREQVVLGVSAQLIGLMVLVIGDRGMLGRRQAQLGTRARMLPAGAARGLLGALAAIPIAFAISFVVQLILRSAGMHTDDHPMIRALRDQPGTQLWIMIVVSATITAPIFEEYLFRGHLQTALLQTLRMIDVRPPAIEPAWPRWIAIIVAAAAFALMHSPMWMFVPLFVLAICFGYAYERTGNLWVPITMHATFNATSLALLWANS